jgi:hypothetical protein
MGLHLVAWKDVTMVAAMVAAMVVQSDRQTDRELVRAKGTWTGEEMALAMVEALDPGSVFVMVAALVLV